MELRLTVHFAYGTDLPRSPTRLVSKWSARFAFVGKNSTADDERNAIGSARSAFTTPVISARTAVQNLWRIKELICKVSQTSNFNVNNSAKRESTFRFLFLYFYDSCKGIKKILLARARDLRKHCHSLLFAINSEIFRREIIL